MAPRNTFAKGVPNCLYMFDRESAVDRGSGEGVEDSKRRCGLLRKTKLCARGSIDLDIMPTRGMERVMDMILEKI